MTHTAADFAPIAVKAYNFKTGQFVGQYESICKAARKLFIRRESAISRYLFSQRGTGVKSYKDDTVYHFEIVKP